MNNFMLISVCEREIITEQFSTFESARTQMLKELNEELEKRDIEALQIDNLVDDEEEYGLGRDWAWSNVDDDCLCDWKIVQL